MKNFSDIEYWDLRGNLSYKYRGENFYTVTAIPYYYIRRKILLKLLTPYIKNDKVKTVCDFGCGDGWYLRHYSREISGKTWYGIDISESMLKLAQQNCPQANYSISGEEIQENIFFDLVYSIAVFAHILNDDDILKIFKSINSRLATGGIFIIFEQTGIKRNQGKTWCRRTFEDYVKLADNAGFIVRDYKFLSFPFHRFFEKKIATLIYRIVFRKYDHNMRRIEANKNPFFRLLSHFFVLLSGNPVTRSKRKTDGNSFIILQKN